jgi:hypothetical protein
VEELVAVSPQLKESPAKIIFFLLIVIELVPIAKGT